MARRLASSPRAQHLQTEGGANEYMPLLAAEQGEGGLGMGDYPDHARSEQGGASSASFRSQQQSPASMQPILQGRQASPQMSRGRDQNGKKQLDVVQFANMFFYVNESGGKVQVSAMRIGNLATPCSVDFHTEDGSAKAGHKYKKTEGKIEFRPGEEMKSVDIKIIEDDSFDTNLDFSVILTEPNNCIMGEHPFQSCRVVIIDDDIFPTNKYKDRILKEEGLDKIGTQLLWAFIKFAILRIPLVRYRTIINLMMDQVYNLAYLWSIWLNVYLVDVVLAVHKPESMEELWVPKERLWTAVLCAFGYIIPKAILNYIDFQKDNDLAVGGKVKAHLKVNLFRKYLYYSQSSHAKISAQELTKTMQDDIDALVKYGFMVVFQLAQQTIKVFIILYFLVKKRPLMAAPLIIYPIAMVLVLNLRYALTLVYKDEVRDAAQATQQCVRVSVEKNDILLIKEYNMRNSVVKRYETTLRAEGPAGDNYGIYDFHTMLIMPWITHVSIFAFTIIGGHFVLTDQLSLGAFLAAIGIYKDAGDLFAGFYSHLKECYGVIGPLLRVVRLLNLDTDVVGAMAQAKERTDGMLAELKADEQKRKEHGLGPRASMSRFDTLNLNLVHASLANDRGGPLYPSLQDITHSVPQGKLVAILGPHGSGKFSMLRLLTGLVKPRNGCVIVPTHLRCICVPNVPEIFRSGTLLENLTFGTKGFYDRDRLVRLCQAVGLSKFIMKMVETDMAGERPPDKGVAAIAPAKKKDAGVPWFDELSQSELLKVHIIRALNINAEVLLLHRPVDEMEADHAARILEILRKVVDQRGIFNSPLQETITRPHTVFFTTGEDRERAESAADVADLVWHLSEDGFRVEPGGHSNNLQANNRAPGGGDGGPTNKIQKSWSNQVRNLQVNLDQQQYLHTVTVDELQQQRHEVDMLREENEQAKGTLNDVTSQAKRALRDAKAYETELKQWEKEQEQTSMFTCGSRKGVQPQPKAMSRNISEIITAGEGRAKSRGRSPHPNNEHALD